MVRLPAMPVPDARSGPTRTSHRHGSATGSGVRSSVRTADMPAMAIVARSRTLTGMIAGDASLLLFPAAIIALQALCRFRARNSERRQGLVNDLPLSTSNGVSPPNRALWRWLRPRACRSGERLGTRCPVGAGVLLALLACAPVTGEEVTLAMVADTSIAASTGERALNYGHSPRLKLKGLENIILLAVDAGALKGRVVEHAVLHLKACADNLMVRKVGVSTVATPWNEGVSEGDGEGKPGDSCFDSPALGTPRRWAGAGSCFLDAVFARGGTRWTQAYVLREADGWYAIPIDGRLLEACACGLSSGLALSDDNGQTMAVSKEVVPGTNFSNNFFYSREQGNARPTITATLAPATAPATARAIAVEVRPWIAGADRSSGGLEVVWPGPADEAAERAIIGYRLSSADPAGTMVELPRWQHPGVAAAGEQARALLRFQTPLAESTIAVEVVGRGGAVLARGRAAGAASASFAAVRPLSPGKLAATAAGAPPFDAAGRVWAVPELAKVNPITGNALEEPGVAYNGEPAGAYSQANPGWSGATRSITVSALRGEWVGFALVCQTLKDGGDWSVVPHALKAAGGEIPASAIRLSRVWYQKVGGGPRDWYGDPLLPLAAHERFRIPDARNGIPGQTTQTIHGELLVPLQAAPGSYAGVIDIDDGGAGPLHLTLAVEVAGATMPQRTAFQYSMNAYSSPGEYFGAGGSEAFLAGERAFYAMAHEHRTTLAVLGYGHSAHFQDGIAWPLTGSGPDMAVADWSAWDRRFGPLFDGSAFAGSARAGIALDHFYLPFMESWPTPMATGYTWNNLTWEEHWQGAGPVADGFSRLYQEQWVAVMRDFEKHVMAKGWQTAFQVYLNDKYFYKQYDPKRKRDGEGTSFWLLDEPQHIDDFSALAFFGGLIRSAQQGDRSRVLYRADISRPQWGQDLLDRCLDLNVSGGFADFRPWLEGWRDRHGQRIWTYGGAPPSTSSAYAIERQALDLYARGVDGFVPWLTLGDERSWGEFADTCVFYDGKPMGIAGPCASLRLKAYRRGEQDVEYVQLLASMLGLLAHDPDRRQVALLLEGALGGSMQRGTLDAQGAVTEDPSMAWRSGISPPCAVRSPGG